MEEISGNLERVNETIAMACGRCGRSPEEIALMAVSKNHSAEEVTAAIHAGQRLFGENRVQEAAAKFSKIDLEYTLHMIGHLQRNKVRDALEVSSCIESVDAVRTVKKISDSIGDGTIDILIQVNTSGEETKSGVESEDDLYRLIDECLALPGIHLKGLMTMAPFTDDESRIRRSFRILKAYFDSVPPRYDIPGWDVLSMGMSSDYTIAIEEGSTLVRIGTAIFGQRAYT